MAWPSRDLSRTDNNDKSLQEDGTWTDIPRCIEHDPGVEEQVHDDETMVIGPVQPKETPKVKTFFQTFDTQKLSRLSKNFPSYPKIFPTVRNLLAPSGALVFIMVY